MSWSYIPGSLLREPAINRCEHCEAAEARMYLDGYLYCSQECAQECASEGCWSSVPLEGARES